MGRIVREWNDEERRPIGIWLSNHDYQAFQEARDRNKATNAEVMTAFMKDYIEGRTL